MVLLIMSTQGDATYEPNYFASWKDADGGIRRHSGFYEDYAGIVQDVHPWFMRGGDWPRGTSAGIFAYSYYECGSAKVNTSFRAVLTNH